MKPLSNYRPVFNVINLQELIGLDQMASKHERLVSQLRDDLNGVASVKIEPQDANRIVSDLWSKSGEDEKACRDAILSLGGKNPSSKIREFKRFGLEFLVKLNNSSKQHVKTHSQQNNSKPNQNDAVTTAELAYLEKIMSSFSSSSNFEKNKSALFLSAGYILLFVTGGRG